MAPKSPRNKKAAAAAKGRKDAYTPPAKKDSGTNALIAALCVVLSCFVAANYASLEKFYRKIDTSSFTSFKSSFTGSSSGDTCDSLREVLPVADGNHQNRVLTLLHSFHLEDTMRDTPWDNRPPALVLFKAASCERKAAKLRIGDDLPARRRLLVATYDINYAKSMWYTAEPEMNLAELFNVTEAACPELVLVSRDFGFENRTTAVAVKWDGTGDWKQWVADTLPTLDSSSSTKKVAPVASDKVWTNDFLLQRDGVEFSTHRNIAEIPPQLPAFTEHGWMKRKMPDELWKRLKAFYKNHESGRSPENWSSVGTQTNFHAVPMTLVYLDLDPHERDAMAEEFVNPVVKEWSGRSDLTLNAFYGIREYYKGSELRVHIDRTETHVLSAILQIDQIDMEEPWLLEIIDFNGTRLQLDMEPGDMILYESAKLPHGRPRPLNGGRYVNAFCHFSPNDWNYSAAGPKVFKKKKKTETPRDALPVIVKGECPQETPDFATEPQGDDKAKVVFRNAAGEPLKVFWVDEAGDEHYVTDVKVGGDAQSDTYFGHAFRVRFASDNALALEINVLRAETVVGVTGCPEEKRAAAAAAAAAAEAEAHSEL